ncbi:MAG: UDP-glucose/GDP-mannose dehydrogenase family protein [Patescibacteria group bacterium]|nr:UDP-glucose/GDP-mannose dehydrogenase family protein [Patescibacteria group bacterium]
MNHSTIPIKVTIVGTGYVGLVTGACLAELGHQVTCLDVDRKKIARLKRGLMPIYEPGLAVLVKKNLKAKRLFFTTDYPKAIRGSLIIMIAVGTPARRDGLADLSYVFQAAKSIARALVDYAVIVDKSTVPVGTAQKVKRIIGQYYQGRFDVVSCPEFLREGSAIKDFMHPDRIVIGGETKKAINLLLDVFKPIRALRLVTDLASAELIKYASNAFLATKISFINEISNICDHVSADVKEVAYGMGLDNRISPSFLKAGIGYGGSCFPKDVSALHQMAGRNGYEFKLLKSVIQVNNLQRQVALRKAKNLLGSLKNKKIGVMGLAFKKNTDDIRESAAIDLIKLLQKAGSVVSAFDPMASLNAKKRLQGVEIARSPYSLAKGQDLLIIATEWPEFRELDWKRIKGLMRSPQLVDGRNLLDQNTMRKLGYKYLGIGR